MEGASTATSLDGRSLGGSDYLNLGMFGGSNSASSANHPPQQPSEVLVGGTAAGGGLGALGNGFGNDSSVAAAGVGAPATSFDLNDFPSLGVSAGGSNGTNELAAALRQQQMMAHQQMLQGGSTTSKAPSTNMYRLATLSGNNANFSMATEDFPALSGTPVGGVNGSALNTSSLLAGGTNPANPRPGPGSATSSGMYGASDLEGSSQLEGGAGLLGGTGLGGLSGLRGLQQPASSSLLRTPASTPSSGTIGSPSVGAGNSSAGAGSSLSGDYGLLGLLSVIRMTDADRNALALGSDLTMLGLNLGKVENIYSTFSSPWSDSSKSKEPHYQLPSCYYMQPPALKTGHLSKFQLETLFYIFYALSKDVLQAYAAQELYSREWRYHGELKLWFKRASPADGVANAASGANQFIYFDISAWERRLFNGSMNQNITNGFLPEEEVRVKFSSS